MNSAHLHLALNHLPVVTLPIALGVLVAGRLLGSEVTMRVGLWLLVLGGVFSLPAFFTGEPAEDIAKKLAGISKALIHRHEDAAKFAFGLALGAGGLGAGTLFLARAGRAIPTFALALVATAALVATGSMIYTAKLGGEIRHDEIRTARIP